MKLAVTLSAAALTAASFAAGTRTWQHGSQADFEKGKLTKLSLRSDGRLTLAPAFREIHDPSVPYLWGLAENSKGVVYAGGGGGESNSAKLFAIDAAGKASVLAELPGLTISAIAVDARDRVYVATAPDGKVYRITSEKSREIFYDPKAKYIWALVFNRQGDLFVATGDQGEIHRVTPTGTGSVFFKTEETHARSLAVDAKGNLHAGTEPGGLVLRISPAGEGFVLYQSSKREVTALAVDAKGAVYAAAVGNKTPGAPAPQPPPTPTPSPVAGASTGPNAQGPQAGQRPAQPSVPSMAPAVAGGSEVVRIEADGFPRRVWSHNTDIAYAIAFDPQGRALIGTGNKGSIYRLDTDLLYTLLVNAPPTQVTALISGRQGRVLAGTGNIGKVFELGPSLEKQGYLESDILDAGFFSYWGRLHYTGELSGGGVKLETRSGNLEPPQKNWSSWAEVPLNSDFGRVSSPPARFLQYKVTLDTSAQGTSPEVSSIDVAYLSKNVAPVIELVGITPPNYRFPPQSLLLNPSANLTLPPLSRAPRPSTILSTSDNPASSMTAAKGHLGARWLARDENGDSLLSKVEIRGANESTWILLKDEVRERNLSWDSTAFPDGEYRLRVTVTDSPSNPPHEALSAAVESDPFVIDNTPPQIQGLAAARSGSGVEVRWRAVDALNILTQTEYSVDGGEWLSVAPTTRLTDSREHDYVLSLSALAPGEHTIAVRVADEYDNQAVAKAVVR